MSDSIIQRLRFIIAIMKRKAPTNEIATAKTHHWSANLLKSIEDPECKIREDDKIVVIKDKYPKAQFHYLVLPKEDILNIWRIKNEHQDLLTYMHDVACDLIKDQTDHEFLIGYHAMPSMQRLHLHVISTDFNSPCLKTKYHWNSFTTPFFLHSQDVCNQLRIDGKIKKISPQACTDYLNTKLKCHKCSTQPKNMPHLKRHLLTHIDNCKL
ncbi:PREDICTED: aprataxin [Trachymyrmex cornetzi]|uniref:aprataxin n=1 Tax=Trachymyrmex cornetzi TaxID=471704 RepID=UPI00084F5C65|nr:PREDICTED: aprataxin [Trachymyrmex cornetzi]XP_018357802.1 PREDICTED: aprataxin [Trachymyrmex cornetzi]XP_018357803.1 PREDICTED: aprataxin [Trachymyrmex cornetzi]